ncbi:acyltransferase family protein [Corynebacterium urogenitale]
MRRRTWQVPFRRGRIDGLDGLRALAVLAVLIFHLDPEALPGGFIGVDVFFVVSGFLITTLLIREVVKTHRINFTGFWQRRIRRLIPALIVAVLTSVTLVWLASLFNERAQDLLYGIGRQILGAATFTSNWLEIAAGSSYFDARVPQLFSTFWSLAVEEQFYLFWPLLFLATITFVPAARLRALMALGVAMASLIWMAILHDPSGDATRVYYGTDTHLFGLMLGVAIAFEFSREDAGLFGSLFWERWGRAIGVAGIVILFVLFFVLGESKSFTFLGGLGLASVASGMAISGILSGPSRYTQALDHTALVWIGERSYGIYIWHRPVILLLQALIPTARGTFAAWAVAAVAVALTLGLAELSLRIVETPIRRHGIRATLSHWRKQLPVSRPVQVGAALALLGLGATSLAAATAPEITSVERSISEKESTLNALKPQAAPGGEEQPGNEEGAAPVDPEALNVNYAPPTGEELTIFGDSMAYTSVDALNARWPGMQIDAESNRRWEDVIPIADQLNEQGAIRRSVVFLLGTNWGIQDPAAVEGLIDRVQGGRTVVLVNTFGAGWEPELTQQLRAIADKYPNVEVADWESAAKANPSMLQSDGVHPDIPGAELMADVISQAFDRLSQNAPNPQPPANQQPPANPQPAE